MTTPFGLTLMRPYPDCDRLPLPTVEIDSDTQVGLWFDADSKQLSQDAKHKRSETNKETATKTSLDGNTDQGADQQGDTD